MLKWTPVIKKTLEFDKEKAERTTIKFRGLLGPIEEQLLFKILFQNNPRWEEISLDIIANDFVTYQGIFLGRKDEILKLYPDIKKAEKSEEEKSSISFIIPNK